MSFYGQAYYRIILDIKAASLNQVVVHYGVKVGVKNHVVYMTKDIVV